MNGEKSRPDQETRTAGSQSHATGKSIARMREQPMNPTHCPECDSTNIDGPDFEGLWDCLACGIWFDPNHPNNTGASGATPEQNKKDE